jgi:hypothetical protein
VTIVGKKGRQLCQIPLSWCPGGSVSSQTLAGARVMVTVMHELSKASWLGKILPVQSEISVSEHQKRPGIGGGARAPHRKPPVTHTPPQAENTKSGIELRDEVIGPWATFKKPKRAALAKRPASQQEPL